MVVISGQRWRSTTVAGGEPPLAAAGPPLTTTGPPVNGGCPSGVGGIFVNSRLQPIRGLDLMPPPAQYLGYKSLAASQVAASYWTATSDVAATSAPVNAIGQRHRSTTVNAASDRLTPSVNDGQRRRPLVNGGRSRCTMMTCHPSIRPATTCTVPRTQIISRQPPATWQHPIGQPPVTWHLRQHRSTAINAAGHRSTAADHDGDQRSTVAVNDGRRWRTTVDCRWTTVDHHRTTGQRWLVNSQRWTWAGSGSGLGQVWIESRPGPPRGIHVDADVDNMPYVGIDPGTSWIKT
nr:hypothetical protein [Tanacetum cinerariifolium]